MNNLASTALYTLAFIFVALGVTYLVEFHTVPSTTNESKNKTFTSSSYNKSGALDKVPTTNGTVMSKNKTLASSPHNESAVLDPVSPTKETIFSKSNNTFTLSPYNEITSMPPWMTAYVNLHPHYKPNEPYIKWVCRRQGTGCGGLGDRLNGIVMSLYIAIMTNRTLILEWNDLETFLEPAFIQWNASLSSLPIPKERISTVDNRNDSFLVEPCQEKHDAIGIEFHDNLLTYESDMNTSKCMTEYWNRFGGRQDDRPLFHVGFWTLFRFTRKVPERADFLREAAGMQKNSPYIAVHIRTGKGATWDDPVRHGSLDDLHQFYDCAVKIQKGMKQRFPSEELLDTYIASDNNDVKKQIHSWSENIKFVSELEVFHIDRTDAKDLDNADQAMLDVWAELKVLIDATCLVMSRSKFSDVGSLLSPQQPRCAVMFDECSDEAVARALDAI